MQLFFNKCKDVKIEDKEFFNISIIDIENDQFFHVYKQKTDTKAKEFILKHKRFDDITNEITFAIKRDNKISLDIK